MHLWFVENPGLLIWSLMRTWVVKWTGHNTQLFCGRAPSKTYFYSFVKIYDAIYYLYCPRKLVLGNNPFFLTLASSLLQKSLGQKEGINPWQPVVDFWGDLASFCIFLFGALAKGWNYFHVHKYAWGDMEPWGLGLLLSQKSTEKFIV